MGVVTNRTLTTRPQMDFRDAPRSWSAAAREPRSTASAGNDSVANDHRRCERVGDHCGARSRDGGHVVPSGGAGAGMNSRLSNRRRRRPLAWAGGKRRRRESNRRSFDPAIPNRGDGYWQADNSQDTTKTLARRGSGSQRVPVTLARRTAPSPMCRDPGLPSVRSRSAAQSNKADR